MVLRMDELKLLEYQIESHNKAMLKILEDINKRLNNLENDFDELKKELNRK